MTKDELLKKIGEKVSLVYQGTFSGVDITAWRVDNFVLVQLASGKEKRIFAV